jgi:hypothetical protein
MRIQGQLCKCRDSPGMRQRNNLPGHISKSHLYPIFSLERDPVPIVFWTAHSRPEFRETSALGGWEVHQERLLGSYQEGKRATAHYQSPGNMTKVRLVIWTIMADHEFTLKLAVQTWASTAFQDPGGVTHSSRHGQVSHTYGARITQYNTDWKQEATPEQHWADYCDGALWCWDLHGQFWTA